jgi:hypothetical protein
MGYQSAPDLLPHARPAHSARWSRFTHGYGIAERLKILSQEVLQVGESSLYPALQRLLNGGQGEWGASETTGARGISRSPRRARSN